MRSLVLLLFLLALHGACRAPLPEPERLWRQAREQAIRQELPPAMAEKFSGIPFFPYHKAFVVRTVLEPLVPPQPLRLAASDGSLRPAHRLGRVKVSLPTGQATLFVYQLDDIRDSYPDHLFLPFRDSLAGKETYGSGRYVEVERLAGGVVELNFNRAYNPDCAFGLTARCPITPEENWLSFPVPVGEKLPLGAY